jgi:hypothetical protein
MPVAQSSPEGFLMRQLSISLVLGACALALAACGGGDDDKKAAEKADKEAYSASPTSPSPKAGLWEETVTSDGAAPQVRRTCVGENASNVLNTLGAQDEKMCPDRKVKAADGGWTMEMTCNMGSGGTVKSTATITGDFTTNYEAKGTTAVTGAAVPHMNRTINSTLTAKWLGPCPEGMGPGAVDFGNIVVDPSGMKK